MQNNPEQELTQSKIKFTQWLSEMQLGSDVLPGIDNMFSNSIDKILKKCRGIRYMCEKDIEDCADQLKLALKLEEGRQLEIVDEIKKRIHKIKELLRDEGANSVEIVKTIEQLKTIVNNVPLESLGNFQLNPKENYQEKIGELSSNFFKLKSNESSESQVQEAVSVQEIVPEETTPLILNTPLPCKPFSFKECLVKRIEKDANSNPIRKGVGFAFSYKHRLSICGNGNKLLIYHLDTL